MNRPTTAVTAVFALAAIGGGTVAATQAADNPKPVANLTRVTGKSTAVKLDAGFVAALTSLKVTPGAVGSAKITKGGSAVFPITSGHVKYYKPGTVSPYVQGILRHDGSGLSLSAGGTTVKLTNFVIDPGASHLTGKVSANGKTVVKSAPLFTLDGRSLKPLKVSGNHAILAGTKVKLRKEAADLLNKTFKVTAFKDQFLIGVATITLNLK
jgi:hypothetical protein